MLLFTRTAWLSLIIGLRSRVWVWMFACLLGLSVAIPETHAQPIPGPGGPLGGGRPGGGRKVRRPDRSKVIEEEEPAPLVGLLDPALANPLITTADENKFKKQERAYTSALKSLSPSSAEVRMIEEGVKFRVKRLTNPDNWPNIGNRTKDLVNDMDVFAEGSPRAREMALRGAVKELGELLFADQPTFVKINTALLLGRLNVQNSQLRSKTPAVPYSPSAGPLIKAINASDMRIDSKIAAIEGLDRLLRDGDPSRQLRDQIALSLASQLKSIEANVSGPGRDWYQWRLAGALGSVEFPRTMTQGTEIPDILWATMQDGSLSWRIRCRAARSLSQVKLDSTFNVHLFAHELVRLTGEMTAAYNGKPNLSYWPLCFSDLYFAFRAKEGHQQQRGWGLLENSPSGIKPVVEGAYRVVLPIVNSVLNTELPRPVKHLRKASDWLIANPPPNKKLHQRAAPLAEPKKPAPQGDTAVKPVGGDRLSARPN